ncbi:MAG: methylenetetrahydrofolate reductase [Gammaproteobacteria bacterium]|nr:methylenetetrahydrofolate reductase [Gammaproteobacteria bacterium]
MKTFQKALRTQDFTLSAELKLDSQSSPTSIVEQAQVLASTVDAIQVTDNPGGRVHMSPLVAAGILLDHDVDPVLHVTCRDRNRIALHSDLLGAAALGVTSLLLMRGQKFPVDFPSKAATVFDWGVRKLIADAQALQSDPENANPPQFFIGSTATAFKPTRGWQPEKIAVKADAGVKFIQTQLCFDIGLIKRYLAGLVGAKLIERVNVIIGIAPIPSTDIGEWLASNLRGTVVPDAIMKRLKRASNPEREGIEICAEMLQELAAIPGVSGANIMSFGDAQGIAKAIEISGLRTK